MTVSDPTGSCPACAAALSATEAVCRSCGSPNLPARRQVVTVLFADLADYTRLSSELDAEQVHLLVRPLMNAVRKECERFGGIVSGIEGDGLMAVFGATQPDEHDPLRAVAAAGALHRLVDARRVASERVPALRVGMNSGEVLLAPSWEAAGFSVSGDVVNVAARLCKAATPGGVLVGRETVRLVGTAAVWGDPAEYDVRNRDEPVIAHELRWDRSSSSATVLTSPALRPYVARPALEASILEAVADSSSVLVVGDAGIGKTRVLQGLRDLLVARGRQVLWVQAPRGREVVGPSVLEQLAMVLPDEALEEAPALVRRRVQRLRGDRVESDEVDSDVQMAAALGDVLWRLPSAVVIVDDLDQADAEERRGLTELMSRSTGTLVGGSREPGSWASTDRIVRVGPLEEDELARFVDALLPGVSASLTRALADLTGGVPLFLEQCVATLLEDGALVRRGPDWRLDDPDRLRALPTSMRVFLEARLAKLPAAERHALGVASVLGTVVDTDLLRHLLGDAMEAVDALVSRDLLRWEPDGVTGEPRLRFRHALLAEAAYAGELRAQRVAIHRLAAEWYAALPVSHVLESQARHLVAAVELGSSDCETVRQAVATLVYFARSVLGERLTAASAAVQTADRLVREHPECQVPVLELLLTDAAIQLHSGSDQLAEERARRAWGVAQETGDRPAAAEAAVTCAAALALSRPEDAEVELAAAASLFLEQDDRAGLARVAIERARLAERRQGLVQRRTAFENAFRAGQVAGDRRLTVLAAQDLAVHSYVESRTAVDSWSARAAEQMRRDDEIGPAQLLLARGLAELNALEHAEAAVTLRSARQAAQDCGLTPLLLNAQVAEIEALCACGSLEEAQERWVVAGSVADERPTGHARANIDQAIALAWARSGQAARASERMRELQAVAAELGRPYVRDWAVVAGQLALERGEDEPARQLFDDAMALDRELEQPFLALRPALLHLAASVLGRHPVPLVRGVGLRNEARERGAPRVAELTTLWLQLDELLHGRSIPGSELGPAPAYPDGLALHLTVTALSTLRPELLLAAADAWRDLGDSVHLACALLWHEQLTGQAQPEGHEVLSRLGSPQGTADRLRALVRGR
jgi:class 3 adenylate cyclase